jgi:hypothetical protein
VSKVLSKDWSFHILAEPIKGRIFKISDWSDLSMFLLCHWPVKYGTSYTATMCSLSMNYHKQSNIDVILKLFISALKEAEIPYRFEAAAMAMHGRPDPSVTAPHYASY